MTILLYHPFQRVEVIGRTFVDEGISIESIPQPGRVIFTEAGMCRISNCIFK